MQPIRLDKLAGTILEEDIELLELLGEGGMGIVYRGRQKELKRELCIKFMRTELINDIEAAKRFRREAATLSKIQDEHIVRVYFVGVLSDVYPYMAMEFVEGISLRELLNSNHRIEWRRASRICLQICETLARVHQQGFVHRDLKPDNILLASAHAQDFVKILDFGICALTESALGVTTLTQADEVIGSVFYMAPECFRHAQKVPAVDQYAIGCMLYEAIAGTPPFVCDSVLGLASCHAREPIPALPDEVGSDSERAVLRGLIAKACAKDPADRFADCTEMSNCLRAILVGDTDHTAMRVLLKHPFDTASRPRHLRYVVIAAMSAMFLVLLNLETVKSYCEPRLQELRVQWYCWQKDEPGLLNEAKRKFDNKEYAAATYCWKRYLSSGAFRIPGLKRIEVLLHIGDSELRAAHYDQAGRYALNALAEIGPECKVDATRASATLFLTQALGLLHSTPANYSQTEDVYQRLTSYLTAPARIKCISLLTELLKGNRYSEAVTCDMVATIAELEFRRGNYEGAARALNSFGNIKGAAAQILDWGKIPSHLSSYGQQSMAIQMVGGVLHHEPIRCKANIVLRFTRLFEDEEMFKSFELLSLWLISANAFEYTDLLTPSVWDVYQHNRKNFDGFTQPQRKQIADELTKRAVIEAKQGASIEQLYDSYIVTASMLVDRPATKDLAIELIHLRVKQIMELLANHQYAKCANSIEQLLTSKLWQSMVNGPDYKILLQQKDLPLSPVHAMESALENIVIYSPLSGLTKEHNERLVSWWFQIARRYYHCADGKSRLGVCVGTAIGLRFGDRIPEDRQLANDIAADSGLPLLERINLLGTIALNEGAKGFRPRSDGKIVASNLYARELYKLLADMIIADGKKAKPEVTYHYVDFTAHLLNNRLLQKAVQIRNLMEPRVKECGVPEVGFRHHVYSLRLSLELGDMSAARAAAANAESSARKIRGEMASPNDVVLQELSALMRAGREDVANEVFGKELDRLVEEKKARNIERLKAVTVQEPRELVRKKWGMAMVACEMASRAVDRGDRERAMMWSLLAWRAAYEP